MFHGVGFDMDGKQRLEEKLLREQLETVHAEHKRIGAVIQERSRLVDAAVQELFLEQQTKDATFAAKYGIVDEIRDIHIPAGVPIISLDLVGPAEEIAAKNQNAVSRIAR
jgi:hypothetical protein